MHRKALAKFFGAMLCCLSCLACGKGSPCQIECPGQSGTFCQWGNLWYHQAEPITCAEYEEGKRCEYQIRHWVWGCEDFQSIPTWSARCIDTNPPLCQPSDFSCDPNVAWRTLCVQGECIVYDGVTRSGTVGDLMCFAISQHRCEQECIQLDPYNATCSEWIRYDVEEPEEWGDIDLLEATDCPNS